MSDPPPVVWIPADAGSTVHDPAFSTVIKLREVFGTHDEAHNAAAGTPVFKARVSCPFNQVEAAKFRMLGAPPRWPKPTLMKNMFCVDCTQVNDGSIGITDAYKEVINYQGNAFLDLTYAQRPGVYIIDLNSEMVYWYDRIEHRNEGFPVNYNALVWGKTTDTVPTAGEVQPVLPGEAPVLYEGGYSLTHIIEGWTLELPEFLKADSLASSSPQRPLIGSCNAHVYKSWNLNRTFKIGTLMLRSIVAEMSFSFRSHRYFDPSFTSGVTETPTHLKRFDMSGKPTILLKLLYEYRKDGWDKFRRTDLSGKITGWYYMRYNTTGYTKYEPFALADHRPFLGYDTGMFGGGGPL